MMWLIANYRPISLFSLKSGIATSSGAKTLFVPTPFAIRTALLDAALRTQSIEAGPSAFAAIKSVQMALLPPRWVAVTNLFARVQKPARSDKASKGDEGEENEESGPEKAMARSIAFREYAYLDGDLGLAFRGEAGALTIIRMLLPQVNYFGKRGSFFQLLDGPIEQENLPDGFCLLDRFCLPDPSAGALPTSIPLGIVHLLDDWGASLTFEKANIYSEERIVLGKDRIRKSVILPYRLARSSRGYSLYERICPGD